MDWRLRRTECKGRDFDIHARTNADRTRHALCTKLRTSARTLPWCYLRSRRQRKDIEPQFRPSATRRRWCRSGCAVGRRLVFSLWPAKDRSAAALRLELGRQAGGRPVSCPRDGRSATGSSPASARPQRHPARPHVRKHGYCAAHGTATARHGTATARRSAALPHGTRHGYSTAYGTAHESAAARLTARLRHDALQRYRTAHGTAAARCTARITAQLQHGLRHGSRLGCSTSCSLPRTQPQYWIASVSETHRLDPPASISKAGMSLFS